MDYFLVEQDLIFQNTPHMDDWAINRQLRGINKANADETASRLLFTLDGKNALVFIDMLSQPVFLVTAPVQELLTTYEPYLTYKEIVFVDKSNGQSKLYFMPILDEVDCLSQSRQPNTYGTNLRLGLIIEEKIQNKSIFKIMDNKIAYVVIRLDLAESILRRGLLGFKFTPIQKDTGFSNNY